MYFSINKFSIMKQVTRRIFVSSILKGKNCLEVCEDLGINMPALEKELYLIGAFNFGKRVSNFNKRLKDYEIHAKQLLPTQQDPKDYDFSVEINQLGRHDIVRIILHAYIEVKKFLIDIPCLAKMLKRDGYKQFEIASYLYVSRWFISTCDKKPIVYSIQKETVLDHHARLAQSKESSSDALNNARKESILFLRSWYNGRIITRDVKFKLRMSGVLDLVEQGDIKGALSKLI